MTERAIPCAVTRGGTSKGLYFLGDDLPTDRAEVSDNQSCSNLLSGVGPSRWKRG